MRKIIILSLIMLPLAVIAQDINYDSIPVVNYARDKEYTIADVKVTGVKYLNPTHLTSISGLFRGQKVKIPGSEISNAIRKYWKHGLFADAKIIVSKIEDDKVWLEIYLQEQPRTNSITITGVSKSDQEDIKEKIELKRGVQVTDNLINNTITIIKRHYVEKGFYNTAVKVMQKPDTAGLNRVDVTIMIKKNSKVKIEEIIFEGNEVFNEKQLRRKMKKTKQRDWNIFKGSKFIAADYKEDKVKLIDFYNSNGYRDAKILKEEIIEINEERLALKLTLFEGNQYYIRSIRWVGNTKYPTEFLNRVLGIKPKSIYDKKEVDNRLNMDEDAISTLYMDNGYLFFNVSPHEVRVEGDSVDLEMRIYEGDPAHINKIIIRGNTKTNEHVIRRELYTRPGELFSKSDLMRTYREIANLGHFNPENIGINPLPNQADGTVDIEYTLEERANDQLELSGGWGGGYGFIGSVGVRFTNLALGRTFDKEAWRPVPTGDGQTLSVKAQSNLRYHSFNLSFMEPWLGGKKPNSFTASINYTIMKNIVGGYSSYNSPYSSPYGYGGGGYGYGGSSYGYGGGYYQDPDEMEENGRFTVLGGALGYGKRLHWPDDYFSFYSELAYNQYKLDNYPVFPLPDGAYNLITVKGVLSRSSKDQMIYPRKGSSFSLTVQATPPYSALNNKDYSALDQINDRDEIFKFIEYHKWNFEAEWYTELFTDFVLALKTQFGALGAYNKQIGYAPFEKFVMGGSGLSGYSMRGTEVVPLRGYPDRSLTPYSYLPVTRKDLEGNETTSYQRYENGNVFTRYYAELRYPVTLTPSASIYGITFAEGGNVWSEWEGFNPFDVRRSAGVGVRAFLPMFGLLGFDVAYGFDREKVPGIDLDKKFEFHFLIGQQF